MDLRIVGGQPDDTEIAALVVALSVVSREPDRYRPAREPRPGWDGRTGTWSPTSEGESFHG
ncbi:acyl-CoA carboxylase subunit epsilon [Amycolatopsis sp. NPDC052450]|uniref:acyl-CoA carboxylase subunit epsilon n=1 Tax=Amycolatopsis sp. NPDC052450 TaxID=3363937 RepID=UPI0037C9F542